MTLETFFEKFNLFAEAPDAVAKMREVVLGMAASGRLCHAESNEWKEGELGNVIELISGQHLLANEHNDQRRGIPYLTGPSDFGDKHPIPTRWTEQHRIVAKVDELMALVDALENQIIASRTTATNLLEALVAELTAQS